MNDRKAEFLKAIQLEEVEEDGKNLLEDSLPSSPQTKRPRGRPSKSLSKLEGYISHSFIQKKNIFTNHSFFRLENLGNTCFLNAVLQIVLNIPSFIEQLGKSNHQLCNLIVALSNSMDKGPAKREEALRYCKLS